MAQIDESLTQEVFDFLDGYIAEQGEGFTLDGKSKSKVRTAITQSFNEISMQQAATLINKYVSSKVDAGESSKPEPSAPQPVEPVAHAAPQTVAQPTQQAKRGRPPASSKAVTQVPKSKPSKPASLGTGLTASTTVKLAQRTIAQTNEKKARGASAISCAANSIQDNNITVDGSKLNGISEDILEFEGDENVIPATVSLVTLLDPDNAEEFWQLRNAYSESLTQLEEKYVLHTNKGEVKMNTFTYSDKAPVPKTVAAKGAAKPATKRAAPKRKDPNAPPEHPCVIYTRPDTGTKEELPAAEAKPIIDYTLFMKAFQKRISDAKVNHLHYLQEPIIRTQNVFKLDYVLKNFKYRPVEKAPVQSIPPQDTNKYLNMGLIPDGIQQMTDQTILNSVPPSYAIDYCQLFCDIKDFNGTHINQFIKKIYSHRSGIVRRLDNKDKLGLWQQAYSNLLTLDTNKLLSQHEKDCVAAWINVLSSRFAYHVVMNCIPAADLFEKSFTKLISEGISIQLLSTVLYPISFAFTPFMLFGDDIKLNPLSNIAATAYKNEIANTFQKFQEPSVFDYEKMNWTYYLNKNCQNDLIRLLDSCIKELKTTEPVDEKLTASPSVDDVLNAQTIDDEAA